MMIRKDEFILKINPKDIPKYEQLAKDIIAWYKSKPIVYKIRTWK